MVAVNLSPLYVVYKMYDIEDVVLYVGVSGRLYDRMRTHFYEKPWITEVARVEVEHVPNEERARRRERELIETEYPVHNIAGQPAKIPTLARIDLLLAILAAFHHEEYPLS